MTYRVLIVGVALAALAPTPRAQDALPELVRAHLWSEDEQQAARARAAIAADPSLRAVSRMRFHDLEEILRQGPPVPAAPAGDAPQEIAVTLPDGRTLPVLIQLPPGYSTTAAWPLMFAMHGGPPQQTDQARRGAERMIRVWKDAAATAGWIVAAPAMTIVAAVAPRTDDRLPYEVLRPAQAGVLLAAIEKRYRVDPNRVVSTGISLGSNFSIAFGASAPDRFAAIVPVSTEGDSRELLLRNLRSVPVYVLEGSRDKNIRAIDGPRALAAILGGLAYDLTYREFGDRAHEGFEDHYPDVLRWLSDRPRRVYPAEVLRVPHPGIMPVARRVHWVETDTRQGLVDARVAGDNRIEVTARWARRIRLFLHDRLVDLDRPVDVWVNGARVLSARVDRSIPFALDEVRASGDAGRIFADAVTVTLPNTAASLAAGRRLWETIGPRRPESTLSFWEMYATRALEERFPSLGFEAEEGEAPRALLAPEAVALRVTRVDPTGAFGAAGLKRGDVLIEVDGEPFYPGRGLPHLRAWLMRELTAQGRPYRFSVWRAAQRVELTATLALGPYRDGSAPSGNGR